MERKIAYLKLARRYGVTFAAIIQAIRLDIKLYELKMQHYACKQTGYVATTRYSFGINLRRTLTVRTLSQMQAS
jgi:hypothetical protein